MIFSVFFSWSIIVFFILILGIGIFLIIKFLNKKKEKLEVNYSNEYSVNDFIRFREAIYKYYDKNKLDFTGVYIIYNDTRKKYYVGKSNVVIDRINMHFTGKGNGDVYADYKNGDKFIIKYVLLRGTDYKSLDRLEKDMITKYQAKYKGYNKTKGNGK